MYCLVGSHGGGSRHWHWNRLLVDVHAQEVNRTSGEKMFGRNRCMNLCRLSSRKEEALETFSFYYYSLRDMISNKPPTLHHRRCDDNAISYLVANTLVGGRVAKPYRQFLKNFCFRADD